MLPMEKLINTTCFMQHESTMIVELSKGRQITIPAAMREKLKLEVGTKFEILRRKNEIVLKPLGRSLEKLFAEAKTIKPKHNLTPEQMDELNERMFR